MRRKNGLKAGCNVRLLHVLQVSFECSVIVSIFKIVSSNALIQTLILVTFLAVWLVSLKRADTLA